MTSVALVGALAGACGSGDDVDSAASGAGEEASSEAPTEVAGDGVAGDGVAGEEASSEAPTEVAGDGVAGDEVASDDAAAEGDPAGQLLAGECGAVPGIPTFCVDATVAGAAEYEGTFVTSSASATCADYADGDEFVPGTLSVILVPSDDTPVSFDLFLPAYTGPGTYSGDGVDPGLSVVGPPAPGTDTTGTLYSLAPGASVTVTINEDGGGSLEVTELVDNLTGSAPATATATWTCEDPS